MNNKTTFYHGTTVEYAPGDYLKPQSKKPDAENIKPKIRKSTVKIYVTNSVDAAKYYANKAAEATQKPPRVYIVQPDSFSMLKINKTDYSTANAKVIGEYQE